MLVEMMTTVGDLVTMGALVVAILGLIINAIKSNNDRRRSDATDVERIVRIDENSRETRSAVSDIKAELRSINGTVSNHERRIIILEEGYKAQWERIDDIRGVPTDRRIKSPIDRRIKEVHEVLDEQPKE